MSDLQRGLASFVVSYLIHSTLLIGAVWLLLKVWSIKSNPVKEALWTVALFGGVVTAGVQMVAPFSTPVRWDLLPAAEVEPVERSVASASQPVFLIRGSANPVGGKGESGAEFGAESEEVRTGEGLRFFRVPVAGEAPGRAAPARAVISGSDRVGMVPAATPGALQAAVPDSAKETSNASWMIGFAIAIAVWSILSLVLKTVGGLRGRQTVSQGRLPAMLARLCEEARFKTPVRLTHTSRLNSPVAFGLFRPEICVPTRAIDGLGSEPQRAMLAHELAHLRRRDPLRLLLCRLVETVFFFQPLNRLARRRLFEVVECRCDAWAVLRLGYGVSLAECLAEVAGWLTESRSHQRGMAQIAMASTGSPLAQRIRRLLREDEVRDEEIRRKRIAPLSWLLLPVVVLAAPAVGSPDPDRSRAAPLEAAADRMTPRVRDDARSHRVDADHPRLAVVAPKSVVVLDRRPALTEVIALLDQQIESIALRVRNIREALERVPNGNEWLALLEPIEQRLQHLEGRRTLLRALGTRLTDGDGTAPAPVHTFGSKSKSVEASDG